ncbi:GNAT family N-acetyltransferase [Paenibacillus oenotherae]|uniref:GNAT family N-acetyltransferase n=2 Tax=Paenibacillus oenotherae TaxID=1435645 RepID=A0ABS7D6D9_9BACL|nr:GNAT family N-acetyltransferase [Paenibacillus oenotherae]MBW7475465.1 GNAT family N-acetyltransferase [Paenibacillus oenotherae]
MIIEDYEGVFALWNEIEGLVLSSADSRANIAMYLDRNKGMSYVYEVDGIIAGTCLCGHDGRRGFIHHVAVKPDFRGRSIGKRLVSTSLERLRDAGIDKCHLFVLDDNIDGGKFWSGIGWEKRSGFAVYSRDTQQ